MVLKMMYYVMLVRMPIVIALFLLGDIKYAISFLILSLTLLLGNHIIKVAIFAKAIFLVDFILSIVYIPLFIEYLESSENTTSLFLTFAILCFVFLDILIMCYKQIKINIIDKKDYFCDYNLTNFDNTHLIIICCLQLFFAIFLIDSENCLLIAILIISIFLNILSIITYNFYNNDFVKIVNMQVYFYICILPLGWILTIISAFNIPAFNNLLPVPPLMLSVFLIYIMAFNMPKKKTCL